MTPKRTDISDFYGFYGFVSYTPVFICTRGRRKTNRDLSDHNHNNTRASGIKGGGQVCGAHVARSYNYKRDKGPSRHARCSLLNTGQSEPRIRVIAAVPVPFKI